MVFNVGEMVLFYVLSQEVGFLATIFSNIQVLYNSTLFYVLNKHISSRLFNPLFLKYIGTCSIYQ